MLGSGIIRGQSLSRRESDPPLGNERAKRATRSCSSFFNSAVDAHGTCPWPGGWVVQGREPHGPEARLGRVG